VAIGIDSPLLETDRGRDLARVVSRGAGGRREQNVPFCAVRSVLHIAPEHFVRPALSMGKNLSPLHTVMPPSQDPDRKEAVLLQVWGPNGKAVFRGYELLREGHKKRLGKLLMTNENNNFQVKTWLDSAFRPVEQGGSNDNSGTN
jgi:hypothetical protein